MSSRQSKFVAAVVIFSGAMAFANWPTSAFAQAPGPESFAKQPTTPAELWDAVDYLVRTGQAKLAVPYVNAFLNSKASDDELVAIRDRYGLGSVLKLGDDAATKQLERSALDLFAAAIQRRSRNPERINRWVNAVSKSPAEREYAIERLREAGPYAVPALIRALENPRLDGDERSRIVEGMGRLDRAAVPALIAVLGAPDATLAADAADALGAIGDPRAVPFLTYPAALGGQVGPLAEAARAAIARITKRPFTNQPKPPARTLSDEAWKYHRHQIQFPSDTVDVWVWGGDAPVAKKMSRSDAESLFGGRFAREALSLAPGDQSAQVALLSLALEKAAERSGPAEVAANDPTGAFAAALAAGPAVVGQVLRTAIADGHYALAETAVLALGRVTDRDALTVEAGGGPLVEALSAPDRRVQYAAAAVLVELNPRGPFAGSSRVVPILSRFLKVQDVPKALVIDGNLTRANTVSATLKANGFDCVVSPTGVHGFEIASESADIDLIFLEPAQLQGKWAWRDVLANIRADARTTSIPVIVYAPKSFEARLTPALLDDPRSAYLVTPTDPAILRKQLDAELPRLGFRPLGAAERQARAQGAATLLARIVATPGSPFSRDVPAAEPLLSAALNNPATGVIASQALGDVPGVDAQRSLAGVLLDPSRPADLRHRSALQLTRSIQRFGPLLTRDQEEKLAAEFDAEAEPALRSAIASVIGALRPRSESIGERLRSFAPTKPRDPIPPAARPPAAPENENPADDEPKSPVKKP